MGITADRLATQFGFDPTIPEERECFAPALALAIAMSALPFLLLWFLDTDRSLSLAFLPGVWLARKITSPAAAIDLWLLTWALAAMILAAALAPHAARAFVMTAAVGWTIAGALVARKVAHSGAAIRLVSIGIVAGAVAGVIMVQLGVGAGTIYFPVYWSARLFGAHQFAGCLGSWACSFNSHQIDLRES
jgi:hypothetical protein